MQLCFQFFVDTLTGSGRFLRSELFHETKPSHCKKSTEVATDLAFGFLTSGSAARHSVKPLETQPSEEFIDLNESDNKLWNAKSQQIVSTPRNERQSQNKVLWTTANDTKSKVNCKQEKKQKKASFECKWRVI